MTTRPTERVYALSIGDSQELDKSMRNLLGDGQRLSVAVENIHLYGDDKEKRRALLILAEKLTQHAGRLQNLEAQEGNESLKEQYCQTLEVFIASLEKRESEQRLVIRDFQVQSTELKGIISRKKRELEQLKKTKEALSNTGDLEEITARFTRKKSQEDREKPVKKLLSRQREHSLAELEKDVYYNTKRYLEFLIKSSTRHRDVLVVDEEMITSSEIWIPKLSGEALEDLQGEQQELAQIKAEQQQALAKAQEHTSKGVEADASERAALQEVVHQFRELLGAEEQQVGEELSKLCSSVNAKIQQQFELFSQGKTISPEQPYLRQAHEEAVRTAQDALKTAKGTKSRLEERFRQVLQNVTTGHKQEKENLMSELRALQEQIESLNVRLKALESELRQSQQQAESYRQEAQEAKGSSSVHQRKFEQADQAVRDFRKEFERARQEWFRREQELQDQLQALRAELLQAKTQLLVIKQSPARSPSPQQPPIIIHPPAAPQIDLSGLTAQLQAMMQLLRDQQQPAPQQDHSGMMLLLTKMMENMQAIPTALAQLQQAPQKMQEQVSPGVLERLHQDLSAREQALSQVEAAFAQAQGEAKKFFDLWKAEQAQNLQLTEQIKGLIGNSDALTQEIKRLQWQLQDFETKHEAMRAERDTARRERDEARKQRDEKNDELHEEREKLELMETQRDAAREERDALFEEKDQREGEQGVQNEVTRQLEGEIQSLKEEQEERERENETLRHDLEAQQEEQKTLLAEQLQLMAERDAARAAQEKAEAERDALQEQLDLFRARLEAAQSAREETEQEHNELKEKSEATQHEQKHRVQALLEEQEEMRQRIAELERSRQELEESLAAIREMYLQERKKGLVAEKKSKNTSTQSGALRLRLEEIEKERDALREELTKLKKSLGTGDDKSLLQEALADAKRRTTAQAKRIRELEEMKTSLQQQIDKLIEEVQVSQTVTNSPAEQTMHYTHLPERREQAQSLIALSDRVQLVQQIVGSLGLPAAESMKVFAHLIPDAEAIHSVFTMARRHMQGNEFQGQSLLTSDRQGSGRELLSSIAASLENREVLFKEPSLEERQLLALAQGWQQESHRMAQQRQLGKGVVTRIGQVFQAQHPELDLDLVVKSSNQFLKMHGDSLIPRFYQEYYEKPETAFLRLVRSLIPTKNSKGIQILKTIKTIRMSLHQQGRRNDIDTAVEWQMIEEALQQTI